MSNGDLTTFFGGAFDPQSAPPDVLPPGEFPILIERAEVKQTKAGTGHLIEIQATILDGAGKGRKLFDRINIDNPNKMAVDIGLRQLASLGNAIGLTGVRDTTQLLNKAVIAKLAVKDDQNVIRTYKPLAGPQAATNSAVQPGQAANPQPVSAQPSAQPEVAAPAKPPWAR